MSRVCHNRSFEPFIPPHFSTQNWDMCHDPIGSDMIEIQPQHDRNYGTLWGFIGNMRLYYNQRTHGQGLKVIDDFVHPWMQHHNEFR